MYARALNEYLENLAEYLHRHQLTLATAESCTGGLLAGALTSRPGSSQWYEGGFVTYRLSAKRSLLEIQDGVLEKYGAVSEPVAKQMAEQTLSHCDAQLAIATTGLAGPDGDGTGTSVGTLWIAWAGRSNTRPGSTDKWIDAQCFNLDGPRSHFREEATLLAVRGLVSRLNGEGQA